jgi:predicted transcriptional regulator of viral defense system
MTKTELTVLRELLPRSPVLTTADAARAAGVSPDVASRDLRRMQERGLLTRITAGIWADTKHPDFSSFAVIPAVIRGRAGGGEGYVSLVSALHLHGMLSQIPRTMHTVTRTQRHRLSTPVGAIEFHMIDDALFGGFTPYGSGDGFLLATPEKALFDVLYFSARRAKRFAHLPEIDLTDAFRLGEMERWIRKIRYLSLQKAVLDRWVQLRAAVIGD